MASKRLRILQQLTELLEQTDGYDLGGKVWRGRLRPGDESEFPYVILFETKPEGESRADNTVKKMPWYLGVQGYTEASFPHTTDNAHELMAAVKQQLAQVADDSNPMRISEHFMLGGLIDDIEIDGGMTFSPDETTNGCYFAMMLKVTLTENLGDPDA